MPYALKGRNLLVTGGSRSVLSECPKFRVAEASLGRASSHGYAELSPLIPFSRGLGALICEKFAREGCNVMVNYNASPDRAKEVAEKCRSFGVKADVSQGVSDNVGSLLS